MTSLLIVLAGWTAFTVFLLLVAAVYDFLSRWGDPLERIWRLEAHERDEREASAALYSTRRRDVQALPRKQPRGGV